MNDEIENILSMIVGVLRRNNEEDPKVHVEGRRGVDGQRLQRNFRKRGVQGFL